MFLPIYDGKPVRFIRLQWVTISLVAINVVIYLLGLPFEPEGDFATPMAIAFGHVPSVSNDVRILPVEYQLIPQNLYWLTALTYAFVHQDIWHLVGNMLFIWVFGDNVEDALGHFRYLIFYFLCAYAAALFHAFIFPASDSPLIGASGAAAGIVAAYLVLHPKMKIWVLFLGRIPLRLRAYWLLAAWIGFQIFMFFYDEAQQVSWAAHLGGVLAGLILVVPMKRREVALFDRDLVLPTADGKSPTVSGPPDTPRFGRNASKPR